MTDQPDDPWLDEFLGRAHRLQNLAVTQSAWEHDAAVTRHIREGFNRRLMMIETALRYFDDLKARKKPLGMHEVEAANIQVNAFYLNLRGALDNLAWVIAIALELFPDLREASPARRGVDLFGEKFTKSLRRADEELGERLDRFETWYDELRDLRDPAAHRIPLYIPPAVMTDQSELDEYRRLEAEHASAIAEHDFNRAGGLLVRMGQVADFAPVVIMSTEEGLKPVSLHGVVERDAREFFAVAEVVFGLLVALGRSGVNSWVQPPLPKRG